MYTWEYIGKSGVFALGGKPKKIQLYIDEPLLKSATAEAKKLGMNRSEFVRLALEEKLSNNSAEAGVDTTLRLLRKALQDEMKPQIERLAKMEAKTTKASATAMYMLLVMLGKQGHDAVSIFEGAEKKAATYLNSRE